MSNVFIYFFHYPYVLLLTRDTALRSLVMDSKMRENTHLLELSPRNGNKRKLIYLKYFWVTGDLRETKKKKGCKSLNNLIS